jgi:leucyl aminopeptidase
MGGFLGVQQGSKFPPQFIHLTYRPSSSSSSSSSAAGGGTIKKIALVGKGLTFDR